MRARVIPPPLLFLVCLVAGIVVQRLRPWPAAPLYRFETGLAAAVALSVAAAVFGGSAIVTMVRSRTPVMPGHDPNQLVTRGPFRVSRNPIYVALVAGVLAFALVLCSAWLVIAAALLVVLLDRLVIRNEEIAIARTFPGEYAQYRKRVRRWL